MIVQMIFFDIHFGMSLGSIQLPRTMPDFVKIIGGFGHATSGKHFFVRGLDVILCHHADGSVSTWKRNGSTLEYAMISHYDLVDRMCTSMLSRVSSDAPIPKTFEYLTAISGPKSHCDVCIDLNKRPWYPSNIYIIGMSSSGSTWKWELNASTEAPNVVSMDEGASNAATSIADFRGLGMLYGNVEASPLLAVGTAGGYVEIYDVKNRGGSFYSSSLVKKFRTGTSSAVHGVAWLGTSSRVVLYSVVEEGNGSEKGGVSYNNIVHIVDVSDGSIETIRNTRDAGKIIGLKPSPTGTYFLLQSSGMPSEIWTAMMKGGPSRVREINLDFRAAEWVPKGFGVAENKPARRNNKHPELVHVDFTSQNEYFDGFDSLPEDMLSFSLSDSRLGILLVKGKKIQDTRPVAPNWAPLVTGEFQVTCCAASGDYVFLGGADGTLARWDIRTGETMAVETGCVKIIKIDVSDVSAEEGVKLALLSSSRTFAVLSMEPDGKFKSSKITWVSGYSRVGYVDDIIWKKLPHDETGSYRKTLMLRLREGGVCLMDFAKSSSITGSLITNPRSINCPLILPASIRHLLCVLIQSGAKHEQFAQALAADSDAEKIEESLWNILPSASLQHILDFKSAELHQRETHHDTMQSPSGHSADEMPRGSLAELLKSRANLGEDSNPGSPLYPANTRSSTDKAAYELGYRTTAASSMGEVTSTLHSIKGSVKDIAVAGKEKVQKSLGHKESSTSTAPHIQPFVHVQSPTSATKHTPVALQSLVDVVKVAAQMQARAPFPLGHLEKAFMDYIDDSIDVFYAQAYRMALVARVEWNAEEEEFWLDLHAHLSNKDAAEEATDSLYNLLWSTGKQKSLLKEIASWHASIPRANIEGSEVLVEKTVVEQICLGDVETAVSMLLSSPPDISKRFYRDALCSLGMAYACATEKLQLPTNDLATSLFVQASRVIAMNAATAGDSLVSVPLLYATSKFEEVVDVLQQNQLWTCSAALSAEKLSPEAMKPPLRDLAYHMARKQGLIWPAIGILIGSNQYDESLTLMLQCQMYGRAQGLVSVLDEFEVTISDAIRDQVAQAFTSFVNTQLDSIYQIS